MLSGTGLKVISTPYHLILYLIMECLIQCLGGNKKQQRAVVFLPRYMGWHRCHISRKKTCLLHLLRPEFIYNPNVIEVCLVT